MKNNPIVLQLAALSAAALLASCASTGGSPAGSTSATDGNAATTPASSGHAVGGGADAAGETAGATSGAAETYEAMGPEPRLALTYDGGVMVVGARDLDVLADLPAQGFTRLNPAGDGRHLFLTEGDAFRVLDAGTWTEPHGNHGHSYLTEPRLTDLRVEGSHPGHAVPHSGRTALYFDGDGRIDLVDPTTLDASAGEVEIDRTIEVDEAHHGVAVLLEDGSLLETVGNEEERRGARVVDADGEVLAETDECPGVHGEAMVEGALVLGCEDGLVIYRDGAFTKVDAPDDYGRIGNQAGSEQSHVVLGDYKVDQDAELERPTRISLTDTETGELKLVELGTSYSFRSLGRGPQGEALVLGYDGALHVIDPESGEVTTEVPVVEEWEEPIEWQVPRPALFVMGQFAYVTEPASNELHIVDLDALKVIDSVELPHQPNEISGVDGDLPEHADGHEDEHDHADHEHEDEAGSTEDHEGHDH